MAALSSEEYDLLNYFEQFWFTEGKLPTKDYLATECLVDEGFYGRAIKKPAFREALVSRGIPLQGLPASGTTMNGKGLSELQLTVANTMLDLLDTRSQKKKLADVGVSSAMYQSWLRDPTYQSYIRARSENLLGDNQHEAHLALVDRVRSGDVGAIKYFNELTGRFVPNAKSNVDVRLILVRVMEAIQKHVSSPAEQEAIANELLALAVSTGAVNNPANQVAPVVRGELTLRPDSSLGEAM